MFTTEDRLFYKEPSVNSEVCWAAMVRLKRRGIAIHHVWLALSAALYPLLCQASQKTPIDAKTSRSVPVIDLSLPDAVVVPQIRRACETFGFFQIVNHSVKSDLIERFRHECKLFFEGNVDSDADSVAAMKRKLRRSDANARGYFDDEFTKQKRDWKEAIVNLAVGCVSDIVAAVTIHLLFPKGDDTNHQCPGKP